jgi:hypothetical protein
MLSRSDLKARIYATCDPASADFCCTEDELRDLQLEVDMHLEDAQENEKATVEASQGNNNAGINNAGINNAGSTNAGINTAGKGAGDVDMVRQVSRIQKRWIRSKRYIDPVSVTFEYLLNKRIIQNFSLNLINSQIPSTPSNPPPPTRRFCRSPNYSISKNSSRNLMIRSVNGNTCYALKRLQRLKRF